MSHQIWDLWFPGAAAQGLPFARGRLDAADRVFVHAAPETLDVAVRDDEGRLLAEGTNLPRTGDFPMSMLAIVDGTVTRQDRWPIEGETGLPVILPGGEVGILLSWWNADDGSEWRWRVEFYNCR